MDAEREERIRNGAYAIWEGEGRSEGRQEQHWEQSCRDCDAEDGMIAGSAEPTLSGGTPLAGPLPGDSSDGDGTPALNEDAKPGRKKPADALIT